MTTDTGLGLSPGLSAKGRARPSAPYPHIDDLLVVPKDIDPNQSIKRLLEMIDVALRQSEMSRNFDRPALALKDYIRASIIAVQVIAKHKDYNVLRDSRSEPGRLYNALLKKISQQSDDYEKIKRNIMEDNKKTGVQPTVRRSVLPSPSRAQGTGSPPAVPMNGDAASSRPQTRPNGRTLQPVNGSPAKTKPAVLPKPQSLHGNAIAPGSGRPAPANNAKPDLTARFANLRGPQSFPGQDPRIKTYPIPTQKPAGPRQMPNSPELDVDSDPTASALPKVPDAVYSPARGSVFGEAARLPTSTPRGLFSRTGSSTSLSSMPSMLPPQSNDFTPAAPTSAVPEEEEEPFELPGEDIITSQQLCEVMKAKRSILLIDIRSREEFDEGHIMSTSIICIEPSILLRENISSEEISESMVLSPNSEQTLFERRDSYDLVVFYDQESEQVPQFPRNSDELVAVSLHRALVHLNYGRHLKRPPRILRGGLDAWVDLMGPLALQPTTSMISTSSTTLVRQRRNGFIQRKGFGRELADSEWVHKYSVPRKGEEKIDPPQLMVRIMSNLFHWMSTGTFETMKAQTLMDYSRQLCKSSEPSSQFGGPDQQDAQEFMSFIMEQLHDETNPRRDTSENAAQPETSGRPLVQAAMEYWSNHSKSNQSMVDRYWRGMELSTVRCMACNTRTHTFSPFGWIAVPVSRDHDMTLSEALGHYVAGNQLDDFSCDHCKDKKKAMQSMSLARMPPLLCLSFRRFIFRGYTLSKSNTAISWDFNDFDFAPYFLDPSEHDGGADGGAEDRAFGGPFRYECYAVVVHAGRQLNMGHYFAYVRDSSTRDQYSWYCYNDNNVTKVRIGSGDSNDMQKEVFRSGEDRVPYLVFFRRKDA
ncbi:ubiquitin carboxyl-terminal hydrolase 2 [Ophiocordyceps sinensis CO18]|uniref:Ubiquitin carboxyl-terminal hydrolase 2 n=1 Tax=Ophiocordyceps sinensis (strain Co18 / CGMCC 3.14243) TaxID=911162 RepID=T5AQL0_OPHSC|nr:ubiquitin carboxyl-terminal hydrolase 2 [Ophiocordyceps sinensis CO18]